MGPAIIFDKSALQALNIDEAVWFDEFFMGNITPIFFAETLADLEKTVKAGQAPERVVGSLADKTPFEGVPNAHHLTIVISELRGESQKLDHRPLVAGGVYKKTPNEQVAIHFEEFPEASALNRWREHEFLEVERAVARKWRSQLAAQDSSVQIGILKNILPTDRKLSDLEALKHFIDEFCHSDDRHVLELLLSTLGVTGDAKEVALKRWGESGRPPVDQFAPYATHVFKVDLLYYLGIHRGFISGERQSNKIDMAYLYYLPFTVAFVSGDNLHSRTVPLFLEDRQHFVSSVDLKAALQQLDLYFDQLPNEVKQRGVMSFSGYPPPSVTNIVSDIWDSSMRPDWREEASKQEERLRGLQPPNLPQDMVPDIIQNIDASTPITGYENIPEGDGVDQLIIKRHVPVKRGKWRMVSKEIEKGGTKND